MVNFSSPDSEVTSAELALSRAIVLVGSNKLSAIAITLCILVHMAA